ncbi:hypothetical protein QQF64_015347 [Cirrhinus molitorella]|uniref:Uncharacterized protein n=1 Tax=Cirrhinus molitorella TaxID=172907 RepID=A0ABR3NV64_9TELE
MKCHFLKSQIIRITLPVSQPLQSSPRPDPQTAPPVLNLSCGELSISREVRCTLHEQSKEMTCTAGGQIIQQLKVEEATEDSSSLSRSISSRRSKASFSPFSSRKH